MGPGIYPMSMTGRQHDFNLERYSRQLKLPEIGETGQARLSAARVLVIGAGGLGSPVLTYLAASGIGHIGVIDSDIIALSNLNRQFLHDTANIGQLKAESAKARLLLLNPDIDIEPQAIRVSPDNAGQLIESYDLVVDCVDNLETRHWVNSACIAAGKPLVEAGVSGFMGFVMTIIPGQGPCYACLHSDIEYDGAAGPPSVLGATAGIAGTIQAMEAIKVLLGIPDTLTGRILYFDAQTMEFEKIELQQNQNCPACGFKSSNAPSGPRPAP